YPPTATATMTASPPPTALPPTAGQPPAQTAESATAYPRSSHRPQVGWCPRSAQSLSVCRRGHRRERSRQRGTGRGVEQASLAGDGGLSLRGERGFEFVEQRVKAPDHLGRIGAVADDLGQGQHEEFVEVPQLPLDPHCPAGIHPQTGRIEPVA